MNLASKFYFSVYYCFYIYKILVGKVFSRLLNYGLFSLWSPNFNLNKNGHLPLIWFYRVVTLGIPTPFTYIVAGKAKIASPQHFIQPPHHLKDATSFKIGHVTVHISILFLLPSSQRNNKTNGEQGCYLYFFKLKTTFSLLTIIQIMRVINNCF